MKIVFLSVFFSPNGGVGNYLINLTAALKASGHEVSVIHDDMEASFIKRDISFHWISGSCSYAAPDQDNEAARKALRILEKIQPDIVHMQDCNNFYLEKLVRARYPAVKTFHVYDFCPGGGKYHRALKQVNHQSRGVFALPMMMLKGCMLGKNPVQLYSSWRQSRIANENGQAYKKVMVASEHVKAQAVATGYRSSQVDVVPYFAIPREIKEGDKKQEAVFAFIGRVVEEKGLEILVRAMRGKKKWRLLVVGDGTDLPKIRKRAAAWGIEGQIEFLGWLTGQKLEDIYRRIDFLVLPSLWPEPFGIVGIEALSYSKPVIAFRVGGIPEWLEHEKNGYLIEPYDMQDFARKIDLLIEDRAGCRQLGAAGREKVLKEYVVERHMEKLFELYDSALEVEKEVSSTAPCPLVVSELGDRDSAASILLWLEDLIVKARISKIHIKRQQNPRFLGDFEVRKTGDVLEIAISDSLFFWERKPMVELARKCAVRLGFAHDFRSLCQSDLLARQKDFREQVCLVLNIELPENPRFLLRIDDFPSFYADSRHFLEFHEIIRNHNIPYLLAVTPFLDRISGGRMTEDEWKILKQATEEGAEVALHGFSHRQRSPWRASELVGMPADELEEKLEKARSEFNRRGIAYQCFVAPFNSYDPDTLPVLAKRMPVLCGGPESTDALGYRTTSFYRGSLYVPSYRNVNDLKMRDLKDFNNLARASGGVVIPVTLHWANEAGNGFPTLKAVAPVLAGHTLKWSYRSKRASAMREIVTEIGVSA